MTESQFDITPFLDQDEGQHFDRKSLFEGARGTKQLRDRRAVRETDAGEFDADAGEFDADTGEELPLAIREAIDQLGPRPRRERLRPLIHAICDQGRWVTSAELAELLNFRQHNLTAGHLAPMVESGQLERRFPGQPNHPRQAYRAVARSSV